MFLEGHGSECAFQDFVWMLALCTQCKKIVNPTHSRYI